MSVQFDNSDEYNEYKVLIRLGLTLNEARVFLALYAGENSTAKVISKVSGVAREIVYQVIPKLHKKGLVEEVITTPKTFKPISLENALRILLQRREQEDKELLKKAKEIVQRQQQCVVKTQPEESQITIIAPKKGDPHWEKEWISFKEGVDLIMPLNKFLQWPQYYAEISIEGAMKRKAKMRMITEKGVQSILASPPTNSFTPSLKLKLKYISYRFVENFSGVELVIFDKKKVFVSTQNEKQIKDMMWLCSNNQFIVELANNYFETLWSSSPGMIENKTFSEKLPILRRRKF